jgi:hypothetical protein
MVERAGINVDQLVALLWERGSGDNDLLFTPEVISYR